jgi:hypothetical protein
MKLFNSKKGLFEDIKKIVLLLIGLIVLILIIMKFGGFMNDIVGGLF